MEREGVAHLLSEGHEGDWLVPMAEGTDDVALATRGGACVFLDDEAGCRVHAAHGKWTKPWFCRAFPFSLVAGPEGVRLCWRPECAGRHLEASTPLSDHVPEVLADAEHYPMRGVMPLGTTLPGGAEIPLAAYPRVERALLDHALEPREDFDAVFPALRSVLGAVAEAVGAPWPEPAPGGHEAVLEELTGALAEAPQEIVGVRNEDPPGWSADTIRRILAAGPRPAALAPDAAAFAREELANHVFSGAVTVYDGLAAGLGAFVFACLAARGYAAERAGEPLDAAAFNTAWALWHRVVGWRDPQEAWVPYRARLEALFLSFRR